VKRDKSPGHQIAPHVLELVDRRAQAWSDAVVDVCRARDRGTQSAELADRRGACLEDERRQLAAVLGAIAERSSASRALAAVAQLPNPEACNVPTATPVVRSDPVHQQAHTELTAIMAMRAAGRYDEASTRLTALARTAPTDDPALSASIAYRRADLVMREGNAEAALPFVHDAIAIAERAHDDTTRFKAMIVLLQTLDELGRASETKALVPLLEAAAMTQTLDDQHVAILENTLGNVTHTAGDYVAAERHYRAAVAASEREYGGIPAPEIAGALQNLGSVLHNQGKTAEAKRELTRSVAMFETTVGPAHPDIALPLQELGALADEADDLDGAAILYKRVIDIRTAALGAEHPYLCEPMAMLGLVEEQRKHFDRALELYRQSRSLAEHGFGPEHPLVASAEVRIAELLEDRGQHAEARRLAEHSVKIWDATGASLPQAFDARFLLAQLVWRDGAHDRARVLAEAARTAYAEMAPPYNKQATKIAKWLADHPAR
jgi:tetratricopeptide (TPR) repeat protein